VTPATTTGATGYIINVYTSSTATGTPAFTFTETGAAAAHAFTGMIASGHYYVTVIAVGNGTTTTNSIASPIVSVTA
jgi:altronate dehydratase